MVCTYRGHQSVCVFLVFASGDHCYYGILQAREACGARYAGHPGRGHARPVRPVRPAHSSGAGTPRPARARRGVRERQIRWRRRWRRYELQQQRGVS